MILVAYGVMFRVALRRSPLTSCLRMCFCSQYAPMVCSCCVAGVRVFIPRHHLYLFFYCASACHCHSLQSAILFYHFCLSVRPSVCLSVCPPPSVWPHLFCGAGHEKRRGEQLKWSLAFRLYIGSFLFHVHSYQDQFIQPGWTECVFMCI